ncbi:WW/Rsp5/WWP [Penicillium brevicompactum]|uniref:WW/Rsp5/WWP n=1 Tax=Penicillium brevicompactum TaxID=5074 RepID=A0A9W9QZL8_PENBR|nr:WW/Rsp5/WWP [Penicillium brevicompactum]
MSFAPPPGPPPPSVPEGWKAQYDERYHAWFFIDLATGKSQWEQPEGPPQRNHGEPPVHSPPPSYNTGASDPAALAAAGDKKQMGSNNPYNPGNAHSASPNTMDEDARLAAKLQAEEDARAHRGTPSGGDRGASDDYYNNAQQSGPSYAAGPSQSPLPEREEKRSKGGFLSKLMGKSSSKPRPQQQYASYAQQGPPPGAYYGGGGYPPQPGPQLGYGHPGPGYGGGYGGYPQQGGYYQQPPRKQGGGGMGTAGAAALGVGGGLLGGMLIADAIEDHHDDDYGNNDYGGGDDYGGGGDDFGGGDF